jgi:hypothetical protein
MVDGTWKLESGRLIITVVNPDGVSLDNERVPPSAYFS